jgi:hypothetical protein
MINFTISLTTGQKYPLTGNSKDKVHAILDKLFKDKNINYKIICCVAEGHKVFFDKTLAENNIHNDTVVVLMVDQNTSNNQIINQNIGNNTHVITNQLLRESLALLTQGIDFLINGCKLDINLFDNRGNCLGWNLGRKSGPPGYLKKYYPPLDFVGIGIKCMGLYDNGNNLWLGDKNQNGEWYIAYHAIKSVEALQGILKIGFRRGPFQECESFTNINPLSNRFIPKCGKGVYFIPDFNEAKNYAETFSYKGKYFEVILMCRVNPYKVRIASLVNDLESWIVNGDELGDPNGKKYDDEVRINRILLHIHDKE